MNLSQISHFITCLNLFFSLVDCSLISSKFKEFKIVPEIIPSAPEELLRVSYSHYKADLGNEIPPSAASKRPIVRWEADPEKFYLLTMIDADYPGPGIPQYFHWIVGNIPGSDVSEGDLLASYINPQPPGQKLHRYIFLIFKQSEKIDYYKYNLFLAGKREQPSLRDVLKFYEIDEDPIAGNFFLSKHE